MKANDVPRQRVGIMGGLCALFGVAKVLGGFLSGGYWSFLFILTGLGTLYGCLKSSKFRIDFIGMLLVIYLLANVILTRPPEVFHSEMRYLLFSFLLFMVSPILQNNSMRSFRSQCFEYLMYFFVGISFVSFFCYFLGINWMIDQSTSDDFYDTYTVSEGAGHFGGITNHSMTLGFISGIAVCFLLFKYFSTKRKSFLVLIIFCLGSLFFASSRVTLGAMIVGCVVYFLKHTKTRMGFVKSLILLLLTIGISLPLWVGALAGIIAKQNSRGDINDLGGRLDQVELRIGEFVEHPIIGIGFASVDTIKASYGEGGQIEPGSSWLTVLSMTGIIGFIIVISFVWISYRTLKYVGNREMKALLSSLIAFFVVHLFVEGYIFSGGSALCFTLWLVIGVSRDYKYMTDNI